MDVLALLERRPSGATIREMVETLKLPRTTVYRILNTLQHHDMVRRSEDGKLRLGPRLLALAARTIGNAQDYDLASLSMPHLQALSEQTGEGSKVSVLDDDGVLVVAAVQGTPRLCADRRAGPAAAAPRRRGEQGAPRLPAEGAAARHARRAARRLHEPHHPRSAPARRRARPRPAAGLCARQRRIRAEHPCLRCADSGSAPAR